MLEKRSILLLLPALAACALAGILIQDRGQGEPRPSTSALLPVDGAMFEIAAATGGGYYFWAPGEFARSQLEVPLDGEAVLLTYDTLAGPRAFPFPVDTVTNRLEVFAGAQSLDGARLVRPDGRVVTQGDGGVRLQTFEHMLIVTVLRPEAGEWRLELEGAGRFGATVRAALPRTALTRAAELEPIEIIGFDFVELRGRPGHEGYFPVRGDVTAGEVQLGYLYLSGSFVTAELELVSENGAHLEYLELLPGTPDMEEDRFYANCRIPSEPFRLRVRGRDVSGLPYQRVENGLHYPR